MNHFLDSSKTPMQPADLSVAKSSLPPSEKGLALEQVTVEKVNLREDSRIVMQTDPRGPGAERFRFLRMCLRELWNAGKLRSLQIASPLPQDGKSTIALNLATALAEQGKRKVLLIEADLHRPTLSEQLGLQKRAVGLTSCLTGDADPVFAIRRLDPLGWYLLPAGESDENPTELLQREAFSTLLEKLTKTFDWVLFDSPPIIPLTDALSIARHTDASLLVARDGHTPRKAIEKAVAMLGRQRILGVVLNATEGLERLYSGYYAYYGYSRPKQGFAKALTDSKRSQAPASRRTFLEPPR